MIEVNIVDVKKDFKRVCDLVYSGETVLLSRSGDENLVILTEAEYNMFKKTQRHSEYFTQLLKSLERMASGRVPVQTLDDFDV